MKRWLMITLLTLAGPGLAQDLSKAGIPFSPTQPFGYPTASYEPPGGFDASTNYYYGYGAGYFYGNPWGNSSFDTYGPGNYDSPYSPPQARSSSGRRWPSAREESRLHEIRR